MIRWISSRESCVRVGSSLLADWDHSYAIGGDKDEWAVAQSKVASRMTVEGDVLKTISIKSTKPSIKRKADEVVEKKGKKGKKGDDRKKGRK